MAVLLYCWIIFLLCLNNLIGTAVPGADTDAGPDAPAGGGGGDVAEKVEGATGGTDVAGGGGGANYGEEVGSVAVAEDVPAADHSASSFSISILCLLLARTNLAECIACICFLISVVLNEYCFTFQWIPLCCRCCMLLV